MVDPDATAIDVEAGEQVDFSRNSGIARRTSRVSSGLRGSRYQGLVGT